MRACLSFGTAIGLAVLGMTLLSCGTASEPATSDVATTGRDDVAATIDPASPEDSGTTDEPPLPDVGPRPQACPDPDVIGPADKVPPAIDACPAEAPAWFEGSDTPAPTLKLTAGTLAESNAFVPFEDGDWAPIHWGMRMGAGVWVVLQVELPGETADQVTLELDTPGHIGCELIGTTLLNQASFAAVDGKPGVYQLGAGQFQGACVLLSYTPDEMHLWRPVRRGRLSGGYRPAVRRPERVHRGRV